MSRIRRLSIVALVAAAGLMLTGCEPQVEAPPAPEPSSTPTETATSAPDPSKPLLEELTLSTEGLGELSFGSAPPTGNPAVNLLTFDNEACASEGLPGIWVATYPDIDDGFGLVAPFAAQVEDGGVTRIDIHSTEIYTDTGIHIGSSLDAVLGVYPGGPDMVINHADVSDVYVIKGTKGQLQFEVAVNRIPDYWDSSVIDTVVFLSAIDITTEPFGVAATDNGIGNCSTA
jgi:hypothetical protein